MCPDITPDITKTCATPPLLTDWLQNLGMVPMILSNRKEFLLNLKSVVL
jgi:hypothetical protein